MSPPESKPSRETLAGAARWAAILDADDATETDRAACEEWCAQAPEHREAFRRLQAFTQTVSSTSAIEQEALHSAIRRRTRRMRLTALGVSAAIIAGGTWISLQALSPSGTEENYRTAPGEQQEIALTDGSRVTLDTDGAVDVRITRTHRIVHLDQGQVLVDVMRDPNKPFVVETPEGTATALGTAFIVRRDKSGTLVTVTRSHVRVCPVIVDGRALCRTLGPGERARLNAAAVQMEARVDPAQASLWTEGWLEADDRPVTEVLAELNRYRARPVRFDAAKLSGLRVTGSYSLRDTDRAVEGIAHAVDLVITSLPGGDLSLRRGD